MIYEFLHKYLRDSYKKGNFKGQSFLSPKAQQYQMYYAVSRLDADKFANLDFVMNFGITAEYKVLFCTFISQGGSYEQAKTDVFEPTPTLMLLKLHNYFNWADKKLHTAFFIENKDCINEDLLADFREGGSGIEINPGLASAKPKEP